MSTQPPTPRPTTKPSRASGVGRTSRDLHEHIDIADVERKRIGREFHDGIGQKLTSVSIAASILVEKLEAKQLEEAEDARRLLRLVRETVRDARNLARGLNPSALLHKGLENALAELLAQVSDTTAFSTTLHADDWKPLEDEQAALHVFRIVQESVNNAVKHCSGREIAVTLAERDHRVHVEIVDDGRGLPEDPEGYGGMGFSLMRQRAKALGGTLVAENRDGGGTAIRFTFAP